MFRKQFLVGLVAAVVGVTVVFGSIRATRADVYSYYPFDSDATSGIDAVNKTYTHSANVGETALPDTVINGQTFYSRNDSGTNWTLTGATSHYGGDSGTGNISGNAGNLVRRFRYAGGSPVLTLTNLTPGQAYTTTWYNKSWGGVKGRVNPVTGGDTGGIATRFDENFTGGNDGNLLKYTYTAPASGSMTHTVSNSGAGTFHHYAFSNELAPAQRLLFSDHFDSDTNDMDLNTNGPGRQTGSLAPLTYTEGGPAGTWRQQVGNGGTTFSNVLLLASQGFAGIDQNFNNHLSAGGMKISFQIDPNSAADGNWGQVTIGADAFGNGWPNRGGNHFSILFRGNGGYQAFDGSGPIASGPTTLWAANQISHIDLIVTDTTDGNPFNGVGQTKIDVYANGGTTPFYSFTKGSGGYTNNLVNLQGIAYSEFDNLSVTQLFNEWDRAGGGTWNNAANWTGGYVPNGVDIPVAFTDRVAAGTVTVDSPVTVGEVHFTSASNYTIGGANTLTMQTSPGAGDALLRTTGANATFNAPLNLASDTTADVWTGRQMTLVGTVSGGGKLTKTGGGTLEVRGASNSYSGGTVVAEGVLRTRSAGALGPGTVSVADGANFLPWFKAGSSTITNDFELNGLGSYNGKDAIYADGGSNAGFGEYTISGQITLNATSNIGGHHQNNLKLTGEVTGPGGLTKGGSNPSGTNTLTLAAHNTYGGPTTITQGTLKLGDADAAAANAGFETPAINWQYNPPGASWSFSGAGIASSTGGPWFIPDAPEGDQGGFVQGTGNLSQSVNFAQAGPYSLLFSSVGRGGTYGPRPMNVQIDGTALLSWTPAQVAWTTYLSGPITLAAGNHTLKFEGQPAVGDKSSVVDRVRIVHDRIPDTSAVSISAGATLDLNNTAEMIGPLSGAAGSSVTLGSGALIVNSTANSTFSGAISGTGELYKTSPARLLLNGASTYSGGTTIADGIVRIDHAQALGTGPVSVAGGASFEIWAPSPMTVANDVVLNGMGPGPLRPALNQDGGAGLVTLTGTVTLAATSDVGVGGSSWNDLLITGKVTGPGGLVVDQASSGSGWSRQQTLILTADNDYSGGTNVTGGALRLGHANAAGTGDINVAGGANVLLWFNTGSNTIANNFTLGGMGGSPAGYHKSAIYGDGGGAGFGEYVLPGQVTLNADGNIGGHAGNNIRVTGQITGPGGLTKGSPFNDHSTLFLDNSTNDYSGVTTFTNGIVNAAHFSDYGVDGSLGNRTSADDTAPGGNVGLLFRGGTLQYTGSTPQSTNRAIRVSTTGGGGTIDASGSDPSATLSFTAAASPNFWETPGTRTLTLTGNNTGDNTFAMAIQDLSITTTHLTKSGVGTWIVSGNNNYQGVTNVNAGVLRISNSNALGIGGFSAATWTLLTAGAALEMEGTWSLGEHMHINGAGIGGTGALRSLSGTQTLTQHIALDGPTTIGVEGGATLVNNAQFYDVGSLTKVGDGTLVVNSPSPYGGATVVEAGTLLVNGSLLNTASTTVNGGMLGGNGTVNGPVTINPGGAVSAGVSPGHFFINGTYAQTGTMLVEIEGYGQGTDYDYIEVTGGNTATVDGIVEVMLGGGFAPASGSVFEVLTADSVVEGVNFQLDTTLAPLLPAQYWIASFPGQSLQLSVGVPEPSTLVLAALGLLGLMFVGWRRRR